VSLISLWREVAAALTDSADSTARRLHHLGVGAPAFVDESVAEDDGGILDRLGHLVAAQTFLTARRQQDPIGIAHNSSSGI
jgi:hypothetical protein